MLFSINELEEIQNAIVEKENRIYSENRENETPNRCRIELDMLDDLDERIQQEIDKRMGERK